MVFWKAAIIPRMRQSLTGLTFFPQIGCSLTFSPQIGCSCSSQKYTIECQLHALHHLVAHEELTTILGHLASVPSSLNYIFNLVGRFIDSPSLQDECCSICLLGSFRSNLPKEMVSFWSQS